MNVDAIMRAKGHSVATIQPGARIAEAVRMLKIKSIGAIVVSEDGKHVDGILSERDIVHALADGGGPVLERPVSGLMTAQVVTCSPEDRIEDLMALMTQRRIRHLPVLRDGELYGIVSIGDVVKNRLDEVEYEASSLRSFIAGA
jgi:CBS domain-containing protein